MWDETARLDTVSPAGQMEAAHDDVLPAVPELNMPPRQIKKSVKSFISRKGHVYKLIAVFHIRGDIVSYQNYVLSRMPEVWGKDAEVFNPDRWFKENGESISYSPFSEIKHCPSQGTLGLANDQTYRISLMERRTPQLSWACSGYL